MVFNYYRVAACGPPHTVEQYYIGVGLEIGTAWYKTTIALVLVNLCPKLYQHNNAVGLGIGIHMVFNYHRVGAGGAA